jgi:hypothetical protein
MARKTTMLGVGVMVLVAAPLGAKAPNSPSSAAQQQKAQQQVATKKGPFPAQSVLDIRTGKPFKLASLNGIGQPVLVWFWAPH